MINKERLIDSFIEMVKIESLSRKEENIAIYLKSKMEDMGIEVHIDKSSAKKAGSNTGNLIGRMKGNKEGIEPLFFGAHMDTVSPGDNIKPLIKEGVIYSSGDTILGADDKSGIAAILEALSCIKETKVTHGDIEVVFTIGEEIGLLGARFFNYDLLTARKGYILDSGGTPGKIINQGPAQDNIKAVIHGKAAHAGVNPEDGISSIQVAARAINNMKLLRIDEETTANIGVISGGKATNIVSDNVFLEGEARSHSKQKLDKQMAHMVDCLQKACEDMGAHLEYKRENAYPAYFVAEHESVIEEAIAAGTRIGLNVQVKSTGGGSDVHFFNAVGISTVNLATGMNNVHTTKEEIRIDDLVDTARFVMAIIEEHSNR
ncbi:MAG: peptidase M20 [Firmicutes bacterium HGW-Firmicutes-12]|jgi:tripeptide aminopeptidase|nr:MAG: peptidase M20 [Firmicutes bacterium HGW-Firmicutes-12]